MRRTIRHALMLGVALLGGCCHEPPPAKPAAAVGAESTPAADAVPMKSQEVAMSNAPAGDNPSTNPSPAATQPKQTRFAGTLRGGAMAIGAETTGWRLERDDDGTRVDVSITKIRDAVAGLDGKRVVIHGVLTTANWTERGRKQLLIAERIEPATE